MRVRRESETSERAALVLAAVIAWSRVAAAEPESVRIDYAAPAGCPDPAAFVRSLRERTTHFRQAAQDEQARQFFVRVTGAASSYSGRLEILSPDGSTSVRSVDGTICEEVSEALALMTALAIDPDALTSGPNADSKTPVEPTAEPAAKSELPRSPASVVVVAARVLPKAQPASPPWRWSAGVLGHMTFHVSPTLGYGGDLFVDAEAPASSALGPAARLGLFLNECNVQLPSGVGARFQWAAMSVEGCPVRLGLGALRGSLHPCLAFRLGVLAGEGRSMSQPKQTVSAWSDVGPLLRLRLAVTTELILEAQAALMLPLHRPTFEILDMGSLATAYAVPRLGGLAAAGVAYRFR
jgi:hypothetical protein